VLEGAAGTVAPVGAAATQEDWAAATLAVPEGAEAAVVALEENEHEAAWRLESS